MWNYKNIKISKINIKIKYQNKPQRSYQNHHIKSQLKKESTIIKTSLKKVKKAILVLQKFAEDQKDRKKNNMQR